MFSRYLIRKLEATEEKIQEKKKQKNCEGKRDKQENQTFEKSCELEGKENYLVAQWTSSISMGTKYGHMQKTQQNTL